MKRRVACLFLGLCLVCCPLAASALEAVPGEEAVAAVAYDIDDIDPNPDDDFEAIAVDLQFSDSMPARSALLMEQNTGRILYEKNIDEQIPPASITKIMTLLLVMEALESEKIGLSDMVQTSEYASSMGGSDIWLAPGEEMSVDDMLKAVAIASANDAAAALGEHVAGSNDAFVAMMNERAAELGMANTHFKNATGLDAEGHLTTARDIALMSRELMKHPRVLEYSSIWMDSLRGGATMLVNTNKLVRFYKGANGLKTGTTDGAGTCLSATATRDGLSLIAVVMGCSSSNERFAAARGLLDFGFANYKSVAPPPVTDQLAPVSVLRGTSESVMPTFRDPGTFVVEKGKEKELEQSISLVADLEAPVLEGQVIGKVTVAVGGEQVGQYDLIASRGVERMTYLKALETLFRAVLSMRHGIN